MYAAELEPDSGGEVDRLVGVYFDAAERVLLDVFGYTDSGIDVEDLLVDLEVGIPAGLGAVEGRPRLGRPLLVRPVCRLGVRRRGGRLVMTQTAINPVEVGDRLVRLAVTVTSPHVVAYIAELDPGEREPEVLRLLDLGVDLARRVDQRADAAALDDIRQALSGDLSSLRDQIGVSVDQLTRLAGSVGDRVDETAAKATQVVAGQVGRLPGDVRKAVEQATSDADLARVITVVLTGPGSPLENLEKRLVSGLGQVKQSHDAALAAALSELTSASTALGALKATHMERDRSPAGGTDYETAVENSLASVASARGDAFFDVRHTPGTGGSKKGDYVVDVASDVPARLAVELKRTETGMSLEAAVRLVDETATARNAHSVLIVCASNSGMPAGLRAGETLGLVGRNGLAVCHPADGDPAVLSVAYSLARAVAVSAAAQAEGQGVYDHEKVAEAVDKARRRLAAVRDVERALTRARNDISAQVKHLAQHRTSLLTDLETLAGELTKPGK